MTNNTVKSIIETVQLMRVNKVHWYNLEIGKYRVDPNVVLFKIILKPSHIQGLLNYGVKLNIIGAKMNISEKCARFKQGREAIQYGDYAPYYYQGNPNNHVTAVTDNWLIMDASCDINTLASIEKFCRHNDLNNFSMHNNHVLKRSGWQFKTKYSRLVDIESQYKDIKAIRRTTQGKPVSKLLPIQKRVLNIK